MPQKLDPCGPSSTTPQRNVLPASSGSSDSLAVNAGQPSSPVAGCIGDSLQTSL
jgi:hypothetical protein